MTDDLPPSGRTRRDLRNARGRRGARRARPSPGRAPAGRSARSLLTSTAVIAIATALGVAAAGGTAAFLSTAASGGGVTITAGSLGITVNGVASAALPAVALSPASGNARTFTVQNTGSVPVTLSTLVTAPAGAIADGTRTSIVQGTCPATFVTPTAALRGHTVPALGDLAAGASGTYCMSLALVSTTPVSASGTGTAFTVTVTATQKAP